MLVTTFTWPLLLLIIQEIQRILVLGFIFMMMLEKWFNFLFDAMKRPPLVFFIIRCVIVFINEHIWIEMGLRDRV